MFNTDDNNSVGFKAIVDMVFKFKKIFALSILICVFVLCVYNIFFVVPTYTSNGTIYVNCMSESDYSATEGISQYEIESSRALSMTYMEILRGRSFLESVSADIGYKYSWREISAMISVSSVNNTELLSLNITSYSPEDSYIICKSILDKAPSKMLSIFKRGDVEIIDDANMPLNPSKVGLSKMLLIGIIIGFIIAFAIVILIQMYDTRIRNSEELSYRYKASILGEIIN